MKVKFILSSSLAVWNLDQYNSMQVNSELKVLTDQTIYLKQMYTGLLIHVDNYC